MLKPQTDTSKSKIAFFEQKRLTEELANKTDIDYNESETLSFWPYYENLFNELYYLKLYYEAALKQLESAYEQITSTKERGNQMDWQEKYFDKLDRDIGDIKNSLRTTEERIAQMVNQTLSEMRGRDNQRHQEYLSIKDDIASTRRWIIGIVISIFIGIAGLVFANYQLITSLVKSLK